MTLIRTELLGWLAYLQRPPVLLQLLPLLVLVLALAYLPRMSPPASRSLQRRIPLRLLLLLGELLLILLLWLTQQRFGLVQLATQLSLLWVLLSLLEHRLLVRWLSAETLRQLVSRLLRPLPHSPRQLFGGAFEQATRNGLIYSSTEQCV